MKFMMLFLSVLSVGAVQAKSEYCYERVYSKEHLAKNPKQKAKSVGLKISLKENSDDPSNAEVLLNINTGNKTYIFEDSQSLVRFCNLRNGVDCLTDVSTAETSENPSGAINLATHPKGYMLKLINSEEGFFSLVEKNATCNDGLECSDNLFIKAKDSANNNYLLQEVDCSRLKVVSWEPSWN